MITSMPVSSLQPYDQSGFTLIELAIVILISSLILVGAITLASVSLRKIQYDETQEKLEKIADALAIYVHEYGRLPCPADHRRTAAVEPYGSPLNSGANGTQVMATCGGVVTGNNNAAIGNFAGIVPFRVLGLKEEDVRDAWGHFITYKAAPILTGRDADSQLSNNAVNSDVHMLCRQGRWIRNGANQNPAKASFCCPRFDNTRPGDIWIQGNIGAAAPLLFIQRQSTTPADFQPDSTQPTSGATNSQTQILAITLASHGVNGAFALSGSSNPLQQFIFGFSGAWAGAQSNWVNNNQSVSLPFTNNPNGAFFDDRVLWISQYQMINRFGNNTCATP